jgi:dCMP deaminase
MRQEMKIPPGERYELCRSVHAEANAVINAARSGVSLLGGTLYLYGENVKDDTVAEARPCRMCKRMIINAGLLKVVVKKPEGEKIYDVEEWVKEDNGVYTEKDLKGY